MPYFGNQHIVGDSVNNFKVLDDISTYTETFDGSASSVVSTSADNIRVLIIDLYRDSELHIIMVVEVILVVLQVGLLTM